MNTSSFTRHLAAAGCVLSLGLSAAPLAEAAEIPPAAASAAAYGMDWIPYIDPADLPPVAQRKVVCLVDSGVDVTPDLPADRFEGPIVERVSIDGGSGLAGPAWENQHGTRMASLAGAVSPAVRIVSVRAMPYGERVFPPRMYDDGVRWCTNVAVAYPMAVVNLSLSCQCRLSPEDQARLEDAVARARVPHRSISVVAAAGNEGGGISSLASTHGILPMAAGDTDGALCGYASYDARALVGPGCDSSKGAHNDVLPVGWGGSSGAAMHASVLLAVLRTFKPHAAHEEAESWVRSGARGLHGRSVLHGEGAARAAGLGSVVDRARARMPGVGLSGPGASPSTGTPGGAVPTGSTVSPTGQPAQRPGSSSIDRGLVPPEARVRWTRAGLQIQLPTAGHVSSPIAAGEQRYGRLRAMSSIRAYSATRSRSASSARGSVTAV